MNKKIIVLAVFACIGLSGALLIYPINSQNIPTEQLQNPASTMSPDEVLNRLSLEFSQKYSKPIESLTIVMDTISGDYAKGSITFKDEAGGGLWFAARVNDTWKLVYDGNGIIPCAVFEQYPDYPASLIPQCFDVSQSILITR